MQITQFVLRLSLLIALAAFACRGQPVTGATLGPSQQGASCVDSPRGSVPQGARASSPDGQFYAQEVEPLLSGRVAIFRLETGELLRVIDLRERNNDLKALCWSPDSRLLAIMLHHGGGGYIAIAEAASASVLGRVPITRWYHSLRWSADGTSLLAEDDAIPMPFLGPTQSPAPRAAPSPTARSVATGRPMPTSEPAPPRVPVGPTDARDARFLLGVNYPWHHYGHDFGTTAWGHDGASATQSRQAIEADFAFLREHGVQVVRWFLFADGRAAPEFDADGQVTGFDEYFHADLGAVLGLAEQYDLRLILVLFNYQVADQPQVVNGVQLFGRSRLISDPLIRQSFLDNALRPLLERYGTSPWIIAWEVMSEPEGAMTIPGGRWVGDPVDPAAMQAFVREVVEYIHAYSTQYATVGSAWRDALDYWKGSGLDLYQYHSYEPNDPLECGLDKPVIVGEFPTAAATRTLTEYLDTILRSGCAGALAWSYRAEDEVSDFRGVAAEFAAWSAAHEVEVRIGAPQTQPTAPAELPSPPVPTHAAPVATPVPTAAPRPTVATPVPTPAPAPTPTLDNRYSLHSPDRRYAAALVTAASGVHYRVDDLTTGHSVLTTRAQYPTWNTVAAGAFSPDNTRFAAAYHYSHDGTYTWVGIWSLASGELAGSRIIAGWTRDVTQVFR
ncbi:MAG: hypothetical protein HY690_00285 [Chloroflexi bacterium]|nr:hypothetical protein [Chloroflexota bacterium]